MSTLSAHNTENASGLRSAVDLLARILLVVLYLVAGYEKIPGYDYYAGYMQSVGMPTALLPLVIAFELGSSVLIILGWQTRIVAFLQVGFTILSALIFHNKLSDPIQQLMFLKNFAIAGGFLLLVVHGAGAYSLGARRR